MVYVLLLVINVEFRELKQTLEFIFQFFMLFYVTFIHLTKKLLIFANTLFLLVIVTKFYERRSNIKYNI